MRGDAVMTNEDRAALFAAIAAYLRATDRCAAVVRGQLMDDAQRHSRPTGPRVCEDCGKMFGPHPATGGSYCDSCVPF